MDEALLWATRLLVFVASVGGSLAVVVSAVRGRVAWVPAVAAALILLSMGCGMLLPPGLPFWVLGVMSLPWFLGLPVIAATFPDGRFVPRWSLWFFVASAIVVLADVATGFAFRLSDWWIVVPATQAVFGVAFIVLRYRRSASSVERESARWVLLSFLMTFSIYQVIAIADGAIGTGDPVSDAKANLAILPLVAGLVIAVAAPRLWNVDAAFRATLVVLVAGWALVGVFAGVRALVEMVDEPPAAAAWGAAAVAVAAYPAVRLAMRLASWLVYRNRLAPDGAATMLATVLDADDPRSVPERVVDVVAVATGSPAVALRATAAADMDVFDAAAGSSSPDGAGADRTPIVFRGEVLATLAVVPRRGESELSPRDRDTVAAIAAHAGPALDGVRALRAATSAQAALIGAREEERRRLRRELHDDLGPALSGLALEAAAIARRADAIDAGLADAARELHGDIGELVTRSREISHGLRPPVLDDLGLEAAIRARVGGSDVVLDIDDPGELPAAVDLAALRIVQEAVTNVRRHAEASVCTVRIVRTAAGLVIDVADDGVGMPRSFSPGLGLRSIRERAAELGGRVRIERPATGGTVVSVRLPIADAVSAPAVPPAPGESAGSAPPAPPAGDPIGIAS